MKLGWPVIAVAALAAVAVLCIKYCGGPDEKYWVKREAYNRAVADMTSGLAAAKERIAEDDARIAAEQAARETAQKEQERLRGECDRLRADGRVLAADNDRLRTELQPVIDANPKLRELIDNYDLRLANKDKQISGWVEAYKQAGAEALANFNGLRAALDKSAVWEKQYNDEHALRLSGDALRLGLETKYRASRFWAALGKWGPIAAFGLGFMLAK